MSELFIGIDLAWGDKNQSGFAVLELGSKGELNVLDIELIHSLDDIADEILKYKNHNIHIGIDAPIVVPNETGNREIEKEFNKEFAKYKISMLPINRTLLKKYSKNIRSEELYKKLSVDFKNIFEVYPHSTIAVCFNNYKILPYKRKKGRGVEFIKEQLVIYQNYLLDVIFTHLILQQNIKDLKGARLKEYEDRLDAITCAYTLYYCKYNKHKIYQLDSIDRFITPI